jgi:UDP-GlcNAc:undecaprenyl-phosphate/decaprenyl-phosphate GlcNAc-1-phosphate transferase
MNINDPYFFRILLSIITSCLLTMVSIPVIIKVVRMKHLMDEPNGRSSHKEKTPLLGGVAIFSSFIIVFMLAAEFLDHNTKLQLVIPPLFILFLIGLKDDILVTDPYKKLVAQIVAALIITVGADIRIGTLFGLFGIENLPFAISIFISVFVIVVITNSYNLIDGIDGLAGSMGIIASLSFGMFFYMNEEYDLAILCATLIGALGGFLYFNFSKTNKIFMGDTGSLIVGFLLATMAMKFIQCNEVPGQSHVQNAPTVAILILAVPLFDTLRVFLQRIVRGLGPFHPDRNHVHHYLIDKGLSHASAALILSGVSILLVIFSFLFIINLSTTVSFVLLLAAFGVYFASVRNFA